MTITPSRAKLIDHGFHAVSGKLAGALAREVGRKLPRHGYELRVDVNGSPAWLTRTMVNGKTVWAIYGREMVL